jgi:hypothetical protein
MVLPLRASKFEHIDWFGDFERPLLLQKADIARMGYGP